MVSPAHSWKYRRRFMFIVAAFCMAVILICLLGKPDPSIAGTAVTMSFATLASIVGAYVFGATWDDKGRNANAGGTDLG